MGRPVQIAREAWLERGIAAFGEGGPGAIKIEQLARAVGGSKSSFYWFFRTIDDFVLALAEHWQATDTKQVMELVAQAPDPVDRIRRLFEEAVRLRQSAQFVAQLRRAGRDRPELRKLLRATENMRVNFLAAILEELAYPPQKAKDTAEVLYNYYLGWLERHGAHKPTVREVAEQLRITGEIIGVPLAEGARTDSERGRRR
jgi:AcrR family transcriptional regulator